MFRKLYRYAAKQGSTPILLTLSVGSLVAAMKGALSPADVLLLLVTVLLQSLLRVHDTLFSAAVPVERLTQSNRAPNPVYAQRVALALGLVPLLLLVATGAGWLALILAGLCLSPSVVSLLHRLFRRKALISQSIVALDQYQPMVAVYVSGLANVAYQINQWIPVLERLGVPVVVIARQRSIYEGISETAIPVFYARNMAHVERVLTRGVRTVLYPANTMQNVQALRQFRLNHYFINHGESDKAVNQSKLLQAYDKLLLAGPMAHRRLMEAGLSLREGQIEYVGRPQAEMLLDEADNGRYPSLPLRVLYAPTWEGFVDEADYSSIRHLGLEILEQLAGRDDVEIVFKPHPYTGSRRHEDGERLAAMKRFCLANGIVVEESLSSIHECMNKSDVLICDVSSVLNDYLITRKPIILCVNERMQAMDIDQNFPSARAAYKASSANDVGDTLQLLQSEDPLAQYRAEVRRDSLGDFPEGSLARFSQVIRESVASAVQ
ncbi:CDP-glycerol glycerophosphotransferase family protein [Halopseudomonas pertucinogena]|nr:CDP-glycerol glycerophosphotransferase family protein [Halopseudomonas pertucinogena]